MTASQVPLAFQGLHHLAGVILALTLLNAAASCPVLGQSVLQFVDRNIFVAEADGAVTVPVRRSGDLQAPLRVSFTTADGTAVQGIKYLAVSGSLKFSDGEALQQVVVPILNNATADGERTFSVQLSNPDVGVILGAISNTTVRIKDSDLGLMFQFSSTTVSEDAGVVSVGVIRGDDAVQAVSVELVTEDGTALAGADYVAVTNLIEFAPSERFRRIELPILNDGLKEADESFRLVLRNPTGTGLATMKTTLVTILENDGGFGMAAATLTVAEDSGVARLEVLRGTDSINSRVSVAFATAADSTTEGADFTPVSGRLIFEAGERSRWVSVPIVNDGSKEPTERFRLTLTAPEGGAELGRITSATVLILDNDPGLGFETGTHTTPWGLPGLMHLVVLRGNDATLGPTSVDYRSENLTAVAGSDYEAVAGRLHFGPGELLREITVPVLRARTASGAKTFRVRLENPSDGSPLGISSALVYIVGKTFPVAPPDFPGLSIRRNEGSFGLAWLGRGELARADSVAGPWQRISGASSPWSSLSPAEANFFRITRPRSTGIYVPSTYNGTAPVPLVILLHGSGGTGDDVESYVRIQPLAESRGFLYCHPDGLRTPGINPPTGLTGWNATDAINDVENLPDDDVAYLRGVILEVARQFNLDRKRVYIVGHSHGAFMACRMASDAADLVAGVAFQAGAAFLDPERGRPSEPVNFLAVHGTEDSFVSYYGGTIHHENPPRNWPPHPGAMRSIQMWADYNGASAPLTDLVPTLELDPELPNPDTFVTRYTQANPGGAVELWTIRGGGHGWISTELLAPKIIDWLLAHPKP